MAKLPGAQMIYKISRRWETALKLLTHKQNINVNSDEIIYGAVRQKTWTDFHPPPFDCQFDFPDKKQKSKRKYVGTKIRRCTN